LFKGEMKKAILVLAFLMVRGNLKGRKDDIKPAHDERGI